MKYKMIALLLCALLATLPFAINTISEASYIAPCFIFDDLYDVY